MDRSPSPLRELKERDLKESPPKGEVDTNLLMLRKEESLIETSRQIEENPDMEKEIEPEGAL